MEKSNDRAGRRAALSENKRALLEQRLRGTGNVRPEGSDVLRRTTSGAARLSFAQERLWFLEQLLPGNASYNTYRAWRVDGQLDTTALQQAVRTLIERHQTLRCVFRDDGEGPRQILQPAEPDFKATSLEHLPPQQREPEAERQAAADVRRPFDLLHGPLLRVRVWHLGQSDHLVLATMHHLVADGWSMGILDRELTALYEAFGAHQPSPLEPLPIDYADYAAWQRERFSGEELERLLEFWRGQLSEAPLLELPSDRPRPPHPSFRGASVSGALAPRHTKALLQLAQESQATLFMTVLAALGTLLSRYTGTDDVVIGSPVANRDRREVENLIGLFVNMLPLRIRLEGDPTFRQLLEQTRRTCLDAYGRQQLPFGRLVADMDLERDPSRNPLFQVTVSLQPPEAGAATGSLTRHPVGLNVQTVRFDLEVFVWQSERGLETVFSYSRDLFDESTVIRMQDHFHRLLECVAEAPDDPLSEMSLLTETERLRLLQAGVSEGEYPRNSCIHELFEKQCEETPDAVAVVWNDRQLTFRELNTQANQLAHHLQSVGVGPESLVGMCLRRSPEAVVSALAILKAGGAYVPLDPEYPAARLRFMLEDTGCRVVISLDEFSRPLQGDDRKIVCLDRDKSQIAANNDANPASRTSATNLAYVIYTSGSTGRPKGTCIEHRCVVRLVKCANYIDILPEDFVLQFATLSFDASTFELWGALLNGATLVIYPAGLPSLEELARFIERQNVSTLFLTTALFNQMAREVPEAFRKLRNLLFGGEAVDADAVRSVLEQGPPRRLLHVYGPTESTTFASWYLVQEVPADATNVPIGGPLSQTRLYVLDKHQNQVPAGVPGELYIGGDGLARCYLNLPELTAERFVPDPFSTNPRDRLYRTGDIVRWRPDEALEFLGRRDNQVKIRGFRIEPGEVTAVLLTHPETAQAEVIVREDRPGEKQLVAYVVPAERGADVSSTLRRFLCESLPHYLVPSAWVMLNEMPLTPNGKINRSALPAPSREDGSVEQAEPVSDMERKLAAIWCDLLHLETVGRDQRFFDIGGHSLLLIELQRKLKSVFDRDVPMLDLFKHSTVSQLARYLGDAQDVGATAATAEHARRLRGGRLRLRELKRERRQANE